MLSSVLLAVTATTALTIGVIAWRMERPDPVRLSPGQPTSVGTTPWFDQGETVFATLDLDGNPPRPADLGCRLARGARTVELSRRARSGAIGTRVIDGTSVAPVTTIGPMAPTDTVACSGPAVDRYLVWVAPTDVGAPRVALSLVIAGVAGLGAAALVNPRTRGITSRIS